MNIATLKSKKFGLLALLICAGAIALFLYTKQHQTPAATAPQNAPALTITDTRAQQVNWPNTINASGPIMAKQEAIIGSEISGQRLIEVKVNVGDSVAKGQTLARYNTDMLLAQKAELEANWVQADADRKRALRLKKSGTMSKQLIETYMSKAAVAKARLDAKNIELRYANVVAPEDGVISSRTATLGAVGHPGAELFRMIVRNENEWRGELTAEQIAKIKIGQTVALLLPDDSQATATIRDISPTFNSQTRLATVYADIQPGSKAQPGMYVNGVIQTGQSDAVTVPSKSVVIRDGYSYVFKITRQGDDYKIVQQQVSVGRQVEQAVEIKTGVKAGEQLALAGAGFLHDGDSVRLATKAGHAA